MIDYRDQTPPSTPSTPQLFRDREAGLQNERDQRVLDSPENRRVPEHLPLPVNNDPVVPPLHPQYHYLPANLAEQWANLQPLIPVGQRRRRQAPDVPAPAPAQYQYIPAYLAQQVAALAPLQQRGRGRGRRRDNPAPAPAPVAFGDLANQVAALPPVCFFFLLQYLLS